MDPIPMRQRSRTEAPWRMTRWPTVTSSPTVSPALPVVVCSMQKSWMLVRAPTRIRPTSPRSTAPYHTLALSPSSTSPSTTAFGAMNADAGTRGERPRIGPITRPRVASPRLLVFGIPLAEVFGPQLFQEMAKILRLLLGRLLGRSRRRLRLHRLVEQLVHDEDRRAGAERDRDRIARTRVNRHGPCPGVEIDAREEGGVLEVGDHDPGDLPLQAVDDRDEEIVGEGALVLLAHELAVDRAGLHGADPDRENAIPFDLLQQDYRIFRPLVDGQPTDANGDHAHGARPGFRGGPTATSPVALPCRPSPRANR